MFLSKFLRRRKSVVERIEAYTQPRRVTDEGLRRLARRGASPELLEAARRGGSTNGA